MFILDFLLLNILINYLDDTMNNILTLFSKDAHPEAGGCRERD